MMLSWFRTCFYHDLMRFYHDLTWFYYDLAWSYNDLSRFYDGLTWFCNYLTWFYSGQERLLVIRKQMISCFEVDTVFTKFITFCLILLTWCFVFRKDSNRWLYVSIVYGVVMFARLILFSLVGTAEMIASL